VMTDQWWTGEGCRAVRCPPAVAPKVNTRDQAAEDIVLWRPRCAAWPTVAAQLH
jgi:hypothetical protein